ncbi:hypothetical protein MTO96_043775 [Rhipicephalus appendiculatus]
MLVSGLPRHPPSRQRPSRGPGDRSTTVAIAEALAWRGSGARAEDSAADDGVHRERERVVGLNPELVDSHYSVSSAELSKCTNRCDFLRRERKEPDSRMTSPEDEEFPVYLRVCLGNEEWQQCEDGHGSPSSAAKYEPGTKILWTVVFMYKKSFGLRYKVFLKDEAFLSGLSLVSPGQLDEWARKGELVKIGNVKLSSDDIFRAFVKVGPKGEVSREAETCKGLVVKLLGELGIPLPIDVEDMAKRCSKADDSGDFMSHLKKLRSLLGDDSKSNHLQEPPVDNQTHEESREQGNYMETSETRWVLV